MTMLRLESVPSDEEIQEKLLSTAGMSPRDPRTAEVAVSILLPEDDQKWALSYLTSINPTTGSYVSNCALYSGYFVQREIFGMRTPNNERPYAKQISEAFSDAIQNALAFGAWSDKKAELILPPSPGDIYFIGEGKAAHMCNVVSYEGDELSGTIVCVDGGQVDNTWIHERRRPWRAKFGVAMIGDRQVHGVQRTRILRANANDNMRIPDTERPASP
jgi:hypothetical protein